VQSVIVLSKMFVIFE